MNGLREATKIKKKNRMHKNIDIGYKYNVDLSFSLIYSLFAII